MKTNQKPFYIIVLAIFIGVLSPNLLSDGMFMDGLYYAAISNNLANGIGSFWDLFFTKTLHPHFHEHPPLAFGIQSVFFKLFGGNMLVERIYSFCTFIITGFIITRIWNRLVDVNYQKLAWFPLLLWITVPLVTWSASNNMLENTMMIFTSLSVLFTLKSIENKRILNLVLSGIMLFLGVLTKGLVALFPLSLLLWIFIINRTISFKRFISDLIISLSAIVIPFLLLFIFIPESYESLLEYFNVQIVRSITSIQTTESRFHILQMLFNELSPMIILVFLVWYLTRKNQFINQKLNWAIIFLLLGLSGVIPIMISMKQRGFYILATFPIFSIALSLFILPRVNYLVEKINYKSKGYEVFKYVSYTLLLITIVSSSLQINKIGRDKEKLGDVYSIIEIVPEGSIISIDPNLQTDWSLHGYFQRYGNISLESKEPFKHEYILVIKGDEKGLPTEYKKKGISLNLYALYEKE